jgi:hypothetical protein
MQELLRLAHRGIVEAGNKDNERVWESSTGDVSILQLLAPPRPLHYPWTHWVWRAKHTSLLGGTWGHAHITLPILSDLPFHLE